MGYRLFEYKNTSTAGAEEVTDILKSFGYSFEHNGSSNRIQGTINGLSVSFVMPSYRGFVLMCDTSGYEFISLTPPTPNGVSNNSLKNYVLIAVNNGNKFYTMNGTDVIHTVLNIANIVFNQKTENIITPLVYNGEVIKNLYISPTGLSPVKGTIVTDGINKYISLESALYAKYIEE